MHYTEWIPAFGEKTYYKLDHKGYHHNQDGSYHDGSYQDDITIISVVLQSWSYLV